MNDLNQHDKRTVVDCVKEHIEEKRDKIAKAIQENRDTKKYINQRSDWLLENQMWKLKQSKDRLEEAIYPQHNSLNDVD